ncbi:hypothetical protein STIAU_6257, partial [Stigmatella aurantiaca DW4/3-1]
MIATLSARRRLLFGRGRERLRDGEFAHFGVELGGHQAGSRSGPGLGGQLQVALPRPVSQHSQEVPQVRLGVKAVQPRGGDEGEEVAGALRVVITADEEPRLSADGEPPQFSLGAVVLQQQPTVLEEASQGLVVPHGVAERLAQQAALLPHLRVLHLGPAEEGLHVRPQVRQSQSVNLLRGLVPPHRFQFEDAADSSQPLPSYEAFGSRRFPETSAAVHPARYLVPHLGLALLRRLLGRTEEGVV